MSHFTTIRTEIRDIEALREACLEMGFAFISNNQARGYSTQRIPGEYVIKLKGPYDIAVNRQPTGTYAMTTDWWAGHVEAEVGPEYGRLLQMYGVHKVTREARKKGYTTRRTALKDGSVKIMIGGM